MLSLLVVYALVNWTLTVHEIVRLYVNLPLWDYFNVVEHFPDYRAFHLGVFWQQHNEHRIVFPEIVFALDMLLFRGRQVFSLVVSFCAYFGVWAVMAWSLFQDKTLPAVSRYSAILVASIIAGWQGCAAALAIPFLLQWPFVQISVVLALLFVSMLKRTSRQLFLVLTILSGITATYSSGNGILLWPILIAAAILLNLNWKQVTAIAISGSLSIGLYFLGYKHVSSVNLHDIGSRPLYLLAFVSSYLSMPFAALGAPRFGVLFGLASLTIFAALFVLAIRSRLLTSTPGVVLFGYCTFAIASAFITAAGRMNPSDPLIQAAKASRYLTVPLVYISALAMLTLWIVARRLGTAPSLVTAVVLALLLLKMFPKLRPWYHGQESVFADQQWAALCLESGIMDHTANSIIYPDPGYVVRFSPILRENHLAVFSNKEPYWIGHPVSEVFPRISTAQNNRGAVTLMFPIDSGLEVAGWIDKGLERNELVFVDENARIVGLGTRPTAGLPSHLLANATPQVNWVGFVNLAFRSKSFSTYMVDGDSKALVPLAAQTKIMAIQSASRADMGAVLPDVNWIPSNGWIEELIPPGADAGDGPSQFLSSWNGSDSSTSTLSSSSFTAPANGCAIWPILHGPSVGGLAAKLMDAQTGEVLAEAPLRDQDTKWSYWRLSLPGTSRRVKIVARDEGMKWGQWLAIAAPSECH